MRRTAAREAPDGDGGTERPDGGPAVEVRGLRMAYGSRQVLRGVDFSVHRGEVVALLGPNGAGKSTTVEILEGFRKRSAGEVRVLGADPARAGEDWRSRIGIVLQSWRDHGKWRVAELLAHLGAFYTPYATAAHPRPWDTGALLGTVGLGEHADRRISALSGGQRRRLDIAVGIVGRPEVLFLDEPTVGFDPEARREFHGLVRELAAEERMTILLTTHDLHEAERLADRVLILADGRIVAEGSTARLARLAGAEAEVVWTAGGRRHRRCTPDATGLVRELFAGERAGGGTITGLEVRRTTLEEVYMAMVREAEAGRADEAVRRFRELAR